MFHCRALQGAQRRCINSAEEAKEFLAKSVGSQHQRGHPTDNAAEHTTTAVFVTIWQYLPRQGVRQEDVVVRSQIRFIQTPGTVLCFRQSRRIMLAYC